MKSTMIIVIIVYTGSIENQNDESCKYRHVLLYVNICVEIDAYYKYHVLIVLLCASLVFIDYLAEGPELYTLYSGQYKG